MEMNSFYDDTSDDEMRVLGSSMTPITHRHSGKGWLVAAAVLVCAAVAAIFLSRKPQDGGEQGLYESADIDSTVVTAPPAQPLVPLGDYSDTLKAYTEHISRTVNDIPLEIYIPHNAVPRLFVGTPGLDDKNVVFTTQAADIRADNGKIVGAYVLAGKPLSWGLSKKGYCGIIDGKISVGVADNSPLFEEATETGGYFFRQYPLVDNGVMVESALKGKSVRKALCERAGEIFVVMSGTPESFHDFSEALVDLGVNNAIYLVGSVSYGYFRDRYDHLAIIYDKLWSGQRYENHIQWVADGH